MKTPDNFLLTLQVGFAILCLFKRLSVGETEEYGMRREGMYGMLKSDLLSRAILLVLPNEAVVLGF